MHICKCWTCLDLDLLNRSALLSTHFFMIAFVFWIEVELWLTITPTNNKITATKRMRVLALPCTWSKRAESRIWTTLARSGRMPPASIPCTWSSCEPRRIVCTLFSRSASTWPLWREIFKQQIQVLHAVKWRRRRRRLLLHVAHLSERSRRWGRHPLSSAAVRSTICASASDTNSRTFPRTRPDLSLFRSSSSCSGRSSPAILQTCPCHRLLTLSCCFCCFY